MPWRPPIVDKYLYWLNLYASSVKIKAWQMKGFEHTEEFINMYLVFDECINDVKKLWYDRESPKGKKTIKGKQKQKRKIESIGGKVVETFDDKIDLGDTKSPALNVIRKYMDN